MPSFEIAGRTIGEFQPVFIVAEAGINHNGSEEIALRMIEAAVRNGADAIKFQSFRAERLISRLAATPVAERIVNQQAWFELFKSLELGVEAHRRLKSCADSLGITFLSTPFDEEMADLLQELEVPAFKIASGDLTHEPLLGHVAAKGKPVLLSTGMSNLDEVRRAVQFIQRNGAQSVALLHCVSEYPAAPETLNLRAIRTLQQEFELPVGFSDHSDRSFFCIAAVAAGACIIERHFTLDRTLPGPDQALSMDPEELRCTVEQIRLLEMALGDGIKHPTPREMDARVLGRRSIVVRADLPAGQVLDMNLLDMRRPGDGIPSTDIERVLGRRLARALPAGKVLEWSDLL
jgi:N-acetylneuraminate synthase/N,N'-diacetyllegionaminate synthase